MRTTEDHGDKEEEGAGISSPRMHQDDPIEESLEMNAADEITDTILQLDGNVPDLVHDEDDDLDGNVSDLVHDEDDDFPNLVESDDEDDEGFEDDEGYSVTFARRQIHQLDGNNSDSSDGGDEYGLNDVFGLNRSRSQKRPRLQVDSSEGEEEERATAPPGRPGNVTVDSEDDSEERNEKDADLQTGAKFFSKDGRDHVVYPSTGRTYIFLKSNSKKPSTILRHVNDLLTIYQVLDSNL